MGTHMYPNGTARRGRRMSLEIPTLPISGKEQGAEFYRQPNLFLPYLPSHFYNAKVSDNIFVILCVKARFMPAKWDVKHVFYESSL